MAGNWQFYSAAKRFLCNGTIDLDTDSFRLALYTSASNAATISLSTIGSVNNEVAEGNGYSSSGKPLVSTWGAGASAGAMRFAAAPLVWRATGGDIVGVKFGVLFKEGASAAARKLLCFTQCSASQFSVPAGLAYTITPGGLFDVS